MAYLFSYGTLQLLQVQLDTFGRPLQGQADTLTGFVLSQVRITDPAVISSSGSDSHPILRYTGKPQHEITGTVFALTESELQAADQYEVADYQRVAVRLASGIQSWVYVSAAEASMIEAAASC
jgi:gamma-glutamylcyclotransferase (GGCT)/AIG2-like uncharacterized protein YtfP